MNPFSEMINKFNLQSNNSLKKFCNPIYNHFNVNHFWYYSLTNNGYYTCLGSHAAWMEYYFSEKLYLSNPYLRSPDHFSTGINFIRKVESKAYQESVEIGNKKFNLNRSLLLLEKTENGVNGYGFACCSSVNNFEELCLNELPLLKLFLTRFKEKFASLIKKMEDHPVDISSLISPLFYKKNLKTQNTFIDKDRFLKELQFPDVASLSKREMSILKYVSTGYSASQIADYIFLSRRTVEHYIDRVKDKLNCHSKFELMQIARELSNLGYFIP